MTAGLKELASSATAQQFGFKFVSGEDVPPPPRKKETDTERWNTVKLFLKDNEAAHGQWAMIKLCDKAGSAPSLASRINNDQVKTFPVVEGWEARSKVTRKKTDNDEGESELYIRYVSPTVSAD